MPCCGWCGGSTKDVYVPQDSPRKERKIIGAKLTKSPSRTLLQSKSKTYEPPTSEASLRLSLPYSPAQKECDVSSGKMPGIHAKKSGFMKKKGHLVKNWKKRYVVLKDGTLSYYANSPSKSKPNEDGQGLKGWISLEGAKIVTFSDAPCRLEVIPVDSDKSLLLEADTSQDIESWKTALHIAIRAANINSLVYGFRVPQVVQWYAEQHSLYEAAMAVLEFGHMLKLHKTDVSGFIHLVKLWVQASPAGTGIVLRLATDTGENPLLYSNNSSQPKDAVQGRLDGLEIAFQSITSITKGTTEDVHKTKDMGADSAFFCIKTAEESFIFEVDSRQKRDQWAVAVRDVVNFIQIPLPGVRGAASAYRNPMQFERQMSNRSDDD